MAMYSNARGAVSFLVVFCLVVNLCGTYVVFGLSVSNTLSMLCYGVGSGFLFGQVALLAIWGALTIEPLVIRLPRVVALAVLVLYSWLFGARLQDSSFPLEVSAVISVLAVLVFLVLTAPLWIIRWISRRRVLSLDRVETAREQFTLRHILIWTAVVAALTGLGRVIVQSQSAQRVALPGSSEFIQIGLVVGVISLFVAALGFPLVFAILSEHPAPWLWPVILAFLCCGAPVVHATIYRIVGQQPSAQDRASEILAWYGFAFAALAMTGAGLLLGRRLGFRFLPHAAGADTNVAAADS